MMIMKDYLYNVTKKLTDMQVSDSIVKKIGQHHEWLDGYGYPKGLRGNEITQYGCMIAIVDTYDAITADRCYKAAKSSRKALQILLQDAPKKYDEVLVAQFVQCIGIYPVGTLVKLSNKKVAMVLRQNPAHTAKPVVKVFYSVRCNHYLKPKELDLAAVSHDVKLLKLLSQGTLSSISINTLMKQSSSESKKF
ncbi:HD domain-containing phosphohydrolase [uncultured Paraglaciecola sp.]|jgi:HD-GYP domain-containing protein (c-di-GMP phosphodiesterase class II)|uniref:HD-GYP domain-containing protein n=1 Tax=uncultured Paraglaciecola sp. TaxID=1765024 RepID=UPI00260998AA|nr:HD domain-containing phosphohydrolase [uncultured Paraglaciecola sp.]|tara:strand:- start:884 stop:1462 length:579 start_codon:yes stop_codon:yes gene_type:complete